MLGSLSNWLTRSTNFQEEWDIWEVWQQSQPLSHYDHSDLFTHYLSLRPQFRPSKNGKYYEYCFGVFSQLLIIPTNKADKLTKDALKYCGLLLDFYDNCKGISRRLTGDPECIVLLRNIVKKKSLLALRKYNFNQYTYDYTVIHGHTVAQYSLSTLIMRFFCNYIAILLSMKEFPIIQESRCKYAYKKQIFGIVDDEIKSTSPIKIPNKIIVDESRCASWPRATNFCNVIDSSTKCQICNRITENIWGTYDSCIDCHMKRICSVCAKPAISIGSDNLPKCSDH